VSPNPFIVDDASDADESEAQEPEPIGFRLGAAMPAEIVEAQTQEVMRSMVAEDLSEDDW
jgi:hypothetical protein